MQANNLDDSSNLDAGNGGQGPHLNAIPPSCINPNITFDQPVSCRSEAYDFSSLDIRIKHSQDFAPTSPHSPDMPSDNALYTPYLQQSNLGHLLQVPRTIIPRKRPLSPLANYTLDQPNAKRLRNSGNPSKSTSKKGKPLTSTKKAEEVSEELASEITKCIDLSRGSPKDIQAAIKDRVLFALKVDLSRKRPARVSSLDDDRGHCSRRMIACDHCPVTMARRCDMKYARISLTPDQQGIVAHGDTRKHQKRHTRPYGCTFPDCHKKLGSKNDWKRHENTQHYQIETWRCHEYSEKSAIGQCASVFYRREQFQGHLREKHQIRDEKNIRDQCKRYHIGRNGQNAFWCGFCKQIVELKTKGLDAWEERFSHIDNLHYKKGQTIYDWVHLNSDVSEGVMGRGDYMASGTRDNDGDDQSDAGGSSGDDEDDSVSQQSAPNGLPPRTRPDGMAYATGAEAGAQGTSTGPATISRREKIWHCVSAIYSFFWTAKGS